MGEPTVAAEILRMLDECEPAARDKFIDVVRGIESWRMTPQEVWRRLRQAARPLRGVCGAGRRHFDVRWAIAALQVSAYYGGPDYISDLFAEAKLRGKQERKGPHRVQPRVETARRRA